VWAIITVAEAALGSICTQTGAQAAPTHSAPSAGTKHFGGYVRSELTGQVLEHPPLLIGWISRAIDWAQRPHLRAARRRRATTQDWGVMRREIRCRIVATASCRRRVQQRHQAIHCDVDVTRLRARPQPGGLAGIRKGSFLCAAQCAKRTEERAEVTVEIRSQRG
jgi:hypothetical protein